MLRDLEQKNAVNTNNINTDMLGGGTERIAMGTH